MSAICGRLCEKCIFKDICGGCSFCEASVCSRNCGYCFALCLNRPHAATYLNSIGGPEVNVRENRTVEIPAHIPILPDRLKNKPVLEVLPVVGVHAGNMFSRNGRGISPGYRERGFAGALNVDERTQAILEFYVKDQTLEGFWDKRRDIYPVLKDMGFLAVIAPNFSVYEDAPRIDHLYNIKRSSVVYNELLDAGIAAVPDISWFSRKDLDRWSEQINKNKIKIISFSFQVVDVGIKSSSIWKSYLMGFRYLCQNINSHVEVIIAGLVSPFRVYEAYLATNGQRIHVLNQSAFIQSRRGMLSETRVQNRELSFDQLFERNIAYFNGVYQEMVENSLVSKVLSWDRERLKEFYDAYTGKRLNLEEFRIEKDKLELVFSLIKRQLRKKKIKVDELTGGNENA